MGNQTFSVIDRFRISFRLFINSHLCVGVSTEGLAPVSAVCSTIGLYPSLQVIHKKFQLP